MMLLVSAALVRLNGIAHLVVDRPFSLSFFVFLFFVFRRHSGRRLELSARIEMIGKGMKKKRKMKKSGVDVSCSRRFLFGHHVSFHPTLTHTNFFG
jgi:hypothetical protein